MSELDDVKDAHLAALKALASGGTVIVNLQLQINRLEQTILIYRDVLDKMASDVHFEEIVDELIADAERNLTDEDRARIG